MWLRDKGYDKLFGARAMGRVIQNELKRPLADAILFGELAHGGKATVSVDEAASSEKLHFEYVPASAPRVDSGAEER